MRSVPNPNQGPLFGAPPERERAAMVDPNFHTAQMPPHAYVRSDARSTSAVAAEQAEPRSGTQCGRVYEAIRDAGPDGLTDQQLAGKLCLAENSVRPRRLELSDPPEGLPRLIADSGERRRTPAGKHAIVWVVLEHDPHADHAGEVA
jgi:hypothetical protein